MTALRTPPAVDPTTGAPLLTPKAAAEALDVSRETLYSWVRAKRLHCVRVGRWLRFRLPDVEAVRTGGLLEVGAGRVSTHEPPPPSNLKAQEVADVKLLRRAIYRSGLSSRRFAREVLARDERTIRRWLAGDTPVPTNVVDRLRAIVSPADGR